MAAVSLLATSYLSPSTAALHHPHTRTHHLNHRRPPKASFSFPHLSPAAPAVRWRQQQQQQQGTRRGEHLLARAGPPSTTTLVFAFVFPLSLIIGTVLASIRIADQLDEKFLEEVAMNKAIMEEKEDGSGDELGKDEPAVAAASKDERFVSATVEVTSAPSRSRNRPKREA